MKKISKKMIVSLAAAVVLLLQLLGVKVNLPYVNEVIEAACGILVILGIISISKDSGEKIEDAEEAQDGTLLEDTDSGKESAEAEEKNLTEDLKEE